MESISKKGKVFTGRFAAIAVKIGLAKDTEEVKKVKATKKVKK